MKILKTFVILGNVALLVFLFFLASNSGFENGNSMLLFLAIVSLIVLNIYFLLGKNGECWIGLFLKRKALEEKKKIKDLEL